MLKKRSGPAGRANYDRPASRPKGNQLAAASSFRLHPVLIASLVLKELPAVGGFVDILLRNFRQPEYIHVLINPLPIYGLAMGWLGLVIALFLRSRRAQIATLGIVLMSAASAWPAFEFGEQAYDRVLTMTDDDGQAWLDEHQHRAEQFIYFFYALALLSAAAIALPIKWPKSSTPLLAAVILFGAVTLGMGGYIAYAGGKIRHREFRNEPPPKKKLATDLSSQQRGHGLVWGAQAASLQFSAACRKPLSKRIV